VRLLMVVPRFGASVVGGAETLVRGLALRAVPEGTEVEVATTCALDHRTWANALPAGEVRDAGVLVRRFPVARREARRHERLMGRLMSGGRLSYLEQQELMATSVWSPELQRFVEEEGPEYDLILCAPYLFGVSFWAATAWPERTAMIPCLHDEPPAHLDAVRDVMQSVRGCLFNSPGEERLARRLFRVGGGGVVGVGLDPPTGPPARDFAARRRLGRYVLYAGRIEEAKRVDVAAEHVARYRRERRSDVTLVMVGQGEWRPPARHADAVRVIGYVDEEVRRAAYAEASALLNPSWLESLSLVLLEAWLEGTPALVAAQSDVMREHVANSGGGLTFADYDELAEGLDRILGDPDAAARMGAAGRAYVEREYGWPAVRERFAAVTAGLLEPLPTP
jgi:glycosyltransferase involved in cell wall biosynthesis